MWVRFPPGAPGAALPPRRRLGDHQLRRIRLEEVARLLDRDALEDLLETDGVLERVMLETEP